MAGVLIRERQILLRQRIPKVHDRRDQPAAARGTGGLPRDRPLGAVARPPPACIPAYLLPRVQPVAAEAAHELPVAVQLR